MKAREVRNKVIKGLYKYMEIPVYRSDQVSPEEKAPYMVYSVISPYIKGNTLGHFEVVGLNGEAVEKRGEQAAMSLSFTACSQDREDDAGNFLSGEDEAMDLAEKAQGWFLHAGREWLSTDVVVDSVENVASRSVLLVDEEANRYGFDVLLKYVREDVRPVTTVRIGKSKGEGQN